MLTENGLNFILSRSESGSELDSLATKDLDLRIPLSGEEIIFHHFKLDANVLKQL